MEELILQTKKFYGKYSLEMAELCQAIAYTFERYWNYKIMIMLFGYSENIVETYEKTHKNDTKLADCKAFLYINIAYAYLKNEQLSEAKQYYKKAEIFKSSKLLSDGRRAFLLNGLYRYYFMKDEYKLALNSLDKALKIRQKLSDDDELSLPQHIINTHSNKIRVYLKLGNINLALKEYDACLQEPNIQCRLHKFPDALRRLATDFGDILEMSGNHSEARKSYKEALDRRKALRLSEDLSAAILYKKIAITYSSEQQYTKAMEYAIQAYIIYEWTFGSEHKQTIDIYQLIQKFDNHNDIDKLNARLKIQKEIFMTRNGESATERENDMIRYLNKILN